MNERVSMTHRRAVCLLAAVLALAGGCDESLPVYESPADVLRVSVRTIKAAADTVKYRMLDENNPNLVAVQVFTPPLGFEINVVNTYTETIQDDADIAGTLELQWTDKLEMKASVPIAVTNISSSQYDPATGLITLNPGDSLTLRVYWEYRFTNKEWAFTRVPFSDGPSYPYSGIVSAYDRFHTPLLLRPSVSVKVFRSLSFSHSEAQADIPVSFRGQIVSPP